MAIPARSYCTDKCYETLLGTSVRSWVVTDRIAHAALNQEIQDCCRSSGPPLTGGEEEAARVRM
jgi:hypothetical protein